MAENAEELLARGLAARRRRRWREAIRWLEAADALEHGPRRETVFDYLYFSYLDAHDFVGAESVKRRQLAFRRGDDDLQLASCLADLAAACARQGKLEESVALYEEAEQRYDHWFQSTLNARRFRRPTNQGGRRSMQADKAENTGRTQFRRAQVLRQLGRSDEAEPLERLAERRLRHALVLDDMRENKDRLGDQYLLLQLAEVYVARGKPALATPLVQRALAILEHEAANPPERLLAGARSSRRGIGLSRTRCPDEAIQGSGTRSHTCPRRPLTSCPLLGGVRTRGHEEPRGNTCVTACSRHRRGRLSWLVEGCR